MMDSELARLSTNGAQEEGRGFISSFFFILPHVTFDYVEFRHDSTMLKQALHCAHCSVIFEFCILYK